MGAVLRSLEEYGHLAVGCELVNDLLPNGPAVTGVSPGFGTRGAVDAHLGRERLTGGVAAVEYFVVPERIAARVIRVHHHGVHMPSGPGIGEAAQHEDAIGGPAAVLVPGPVARSRPLAPCEMAVINPAPGRYVELVEL